MENNNVNENVKMVGGFDNLDAYVDWLNSDESDDLANAYAEAYENGLNSVVFIEEKTIDEMKNIIKMQDKIIKEKDRVFTEAYIQMEGAIDKMNDILDNVVI